MNKHRKDAQKSKRIEKSNQRDGQNEKKIIKYAKKYSRK